MESRESRRPRFGGAFCVFIGESAVGREIMRGSLAGLDLGMLQSMAGVFFLSRFIEGNLPFVDMHLQP